MNRRDLLKKLGIGAGMAAVSLTPKIVEAVAAPDAAETVPADGVVTEMLKGVPVRVHVLIGGGQVPVQVESYDTTRIVTQEQLVKRGKWQRKIARNGPEW